MLKRYGVFIAAYVAVGIIFDYKLFSKNAPAGVSYSPTWRFIAGWPVYFFQSSL